MSEEHPVKRLLEIGEPTSEEWLDYRALGLTAAHAPELVRLASDRTLRPQQAKSPADFGPLHAWRALAQLRAAGAVEALLHRLDDESLDDSPLGEELLEVCLELRGDARGTLQAVLEDAARPGHVRAQAAVCLAGVAEEDAALRKEVGADLARQLEATSDRTLATGLVEALAALEATDAAPAIESAYQRGVVDAGLVGPWEELKASLGIEGEEEETIYHGPPLQFFHPSMAPDRVPPPREEEGPKKKGGGGKKGKGKKKRK